MLQIEKNVSLTFNNKLHVVHPDFDLVQEIERELGGVAALRGVFAGEDWKICDLVTLIHMMLQAAGETVDYRHLGNLMLREGLGRYFKAARDFLHILMESDAIQY